MSLICAEEWREMGEAEQTWGITRDIYAYNMLHRPHIRRTLSECGGIFTTRVGSLFASFTLWDVRLSRDFVISCLIMFDYMTWEKIVRILLHFNVHLYTIYIRLCDPRIRRWTQQRSEINLYNVFYSQVQHLPIGSIHPIFMRTISTFTPGFIQSARLIQKKNTLRT